MARVLIWVWLVVSPTWFAINALLIDRHDFSFWFVAGLPFLIGLFFMIGARVALGSWRNPPDRREY